MKYLLIAILLFQFACQASVPQVPLVIPQTKADRKPLTRVPVKFEISPNYEKQVREDGSTFDHKPRVVTVDEKAGKYEFRWRGDDGKEKVIKYQRLGAIDVLVSAKVDKKENSVFLYTYRVQNLPTSSTRLSGFTVQTFAEQAKPIELDFRNIVIADMFNRIPGFAEGKWWSYGILERYRPVINPGSKIDFQLESPAFPGIVGCKADGGEFGSKGAGEEPPPEFDKFFLGTKDWPYGYTIGPVDKLSQMNKSERAKYLLENLPKFVEAGWMADDTSKIYQAIPEKGDLASALEQSKKDHEKEYVTNEVFQIIDGLNS
ncbi:MAG: hypothetical protein ABI999_08360 [Acidobacteriota bacterium]